MFELVLRRTQTVLLVVALATLVSTAPVAAQVQLTVLSAQFNDFNIWIEAAAEVYMRDRPGVSIEVLGGSEENLLTMVAGGVAPDIWFFTSDAALGLAERGVLMDLTHKVESDPNLNMSNFFPAAVDLLRYRGQLFGLPRGVSLVGMMYNVDLFDQRGVQYPDQHWTWETLVDSGRKLTWDASGNGEIDYFGFGDYWQHANRWPLWVYQAGGRIWRDDFSRFLMHEPAAVAGLEFRESLYWEHNIAPRMIGTTFAQPVPTDRQGNQGFIHLFGTGRIAMLYGVREHRPSGDTYNIELAPLAKGPANRDSLIIALSASIVSGTNHPNEAWDFVKFLVTSSEGFEAGMNAEPSPNFAHMLPADRNYLLETLQRGTGTGMDEFEWFNIISGGARASAHHHPHDVRVRPLVNQAVNASAQRNVPLAEGLAEVSRIVNNAISQ